MDLRDDLGADLIRGAVRRLFPRLNERTSDPLHSHFQST